MGVSTTAAISSTVHRTGVCFSELGRTFTEDENEIAVNHGVDSVCYCQHSAISELGTDSFLNDRIVDETLSGCFIQYKNVASL